jgi:SAM-dependent methyltransferase
MAGIEALLRAKAATGRGRPSVGIIYTVTPGNHRSIEEFFLRDLDLAAVDAVTVQMQNWVTPEMGEAYARLLSSRFELSSERYWRSMLRSGADFAEMDTVELARQVGRVRERLTGLGKRLLLLPPTFSPDSLDAYLGARWNDMADTYTTCAVPWLAADITATGELARDGEPPRARLRGALERRTLPRVPRARAGAGADVHLPGLLHPVPGESERGVVKASTLWGLVRSGRLRLLAAGRRLVSPFYRLSWLASAASCGALARLAAGPVPLEDLARDLAPDPALRGALRAWLQVGLRLGELESRPEGWALRGYLARKLADPGNDAVSAFLEEVVRLHHGLLVHTPDLLRRGERWTLADQDGVLVARSSRAIEPLVFEAVDEVVPRTRPVRLLEVGAGSGVYIRHAAARNPELSALGLELQAEVADVTAANLRSWGLEGRATIEKGDVRERPPEAAFDLVTLHNNIYYFPVEERVALLRHLRGFLVPGGRLLLTTGCQGGSLAMELLNLWSASTQGCGRLPEVEELREQMRGAGLESVDARRLVPGESFWAFSGVEPR